MERSAIILAGGLGTRLQGVVKDLPKPMAPINGKPFLTYLLDYLIYYGYTKVILSVGYLHEKIEDFFRNRYKSIEIDYAVETEPLGTGGAIAFALEKCQSLNVLILNGDTIFRTDLAAFETFHLSKKGQFSMVLRHMPDVSRYGSVQTDNNDLITMFTEKGTASGEGLINGGIYLINKQLLSKHPMPQKFSFEKDLMEKIFDTEPLYGFRSDAYFIDIGIPEDYVRAQKELRDISIF